MIRQCAICGQGATKTLGNVQNFGAALKAVVVKANWLAPQSHDAHLHCIRPHRGMASGARRRRLPIAV